MTTTLTRESNGLEVPAAGTWAIDPTHSSVEFSVRHLGLSKVRGQFGTFEGTVEIGERPDESHAHVIIDPASIDTREPSRDEHLRSPDFLDVAAFPTLEFHATGVAQQGRRWAVTGDLSMHGVTRPVVLDVSFEGAGNDPWGGSRAAFSASTEIDRTDFGLTWNQALETGGLVVGKKITITIEAEVVRS